MSIRVAPSILLGHVVVVLVILQGDLTRVNHEEFDLVREVGIQEVHVEVLGGAEALDPKLGESRSLF